MKFIDLLKSDRDSKWTAISAVTAIIALIITVLISSIQIARSTHLVKQQAKTESQRTESQRIIDSIRFAEQMNITIKQFEDRLLFDSIRLSQQLSLLGKNFDRQRFADSIQFDKQFRFSREQFKSQRQFDSISIERQFDTLYSHFIENVKLSLQQLSIAKQQIEDQKDLALRQLEAQEKVIRLEINQRKKATLIGLISHLENKKELIAEYLENMDHLLVEKSLLFRHQGKINQNIRLLKNSIDNKYVINHQYEINYSLQDFNSYHSNLESFDKRLFLLLEKNSLLEFKTKKSIISGKIKKVLFKPSEIEVLYENVEELRSLNGDLTNVLEDINTALRLLTE